MLAKCVWLLAMYLKINIRLTNSKQSKKENHLKFCRNIFFMQKGFNGNLGKKKTHSAVTFLNIKLIS